MHHTVAIIAKVTTSAILSFAGIFKRSMGARNRLGIGLSYQHARLHSLAELVHWNRLLGSFKVKKFGLWLHFNPTKTTFPNTDPLFVCAKKGF
jgi:hypothetical protein